MQILRKGDQFKKRITIFSDAYDSRASVQNDRCVHGRNVHALRMAEQLALHGELALR